MLRGFARLRYKVQNWFRKEEGPGEPLTFRCGSEEELRKITILMCYVCPGLWENTLRINLHYIAPSGWSKSFADPQFVGFTQRPEEVQRHLKRWGCLIARHNYFMGTEWTRGYSYSVRSLSNSTRISEKPVCLSVEVHAPSSHERAEALLALFEWLDGKVSPERKHEFLLLPEDIEL